MTINPVTINSMTINSMMDDLIREKTEKAIDLICPLYNDNIISDAYIIGSVANYEAKKSSDIDIIIINPIFEVYLDDLGPDEELENLKKVVDKLKDIGVQFIQIDKDKGFIFKLWYQLYNGEIFHIIPQKYFFNSLPHIRITKDLCD